jgi:hypothetical protein
MSLFRTLSCKPNLSQGRDAMFPGLPPRTSRSRRTARSGRQPSGKTTFGETHGLFTSYPLSARDKEGGTWRGGAENRQALSGHVCLAAQTLVKKGKAGNLCIPVEMTAEHRIASPATNCLVPAGGPTGAFRGAPRGRQAAERKRWPHGRERWTAAC